MRQNKIFYSVAEGTHFKRARVRVKGLLAASRAVLILKKRKKKKRDCYFNCAPFLSPQCLNSAPIKKQSQMHEVYTPASEGTVSFSFSASKEKIKLQMLHLLQLQARTEACLVLTPCCLPVQPHASPETSNIS